MKGYWFCADDRLGYGDGRVAAVGVTHEVHGRPVLCDYGLHASQHVADALTYAPGAVLYRVHLGGEIVRGDDKAVGTTRTYIARIDATGVLRRYARLCALDVIDQWDAPDLMVRYLRTGDESLRVAAGAAARDAAWPAALAAAKDVARGAANAANWAANWAANAANAAVWDDVCSIAREAARDAASAAGASAASAASAGKGAAGAVARGAARTKQRRRLARMVHQEFQIAEREVTP